MADPQIPRGETRLPIYPEPPAPAEFGIDLRLGWNRGDAAIAADVKAFWEQFNFLPRGVDPDHRVKEVVLAGYAGNRLVAVSTAAIEQVGFLRCKMAVYRCAIAPDFRRQMMSMLVTAHSLKALEAWSRAHPDESVMGMLAVLENGDLQEKDPPSPCPGDETFAGGLQSPGPEDRRGVVRSRPTVGPGRRPRPTRRGSSGSNLTFESRVGFTRSDGAGGDTQKRSLLV